ncbi:MAG: RDD family protein [Nitrososphaera sp.]|uniref:RDD family protein n=1 Tax=Nitrososphaera sp. TaxID=1971748 RepID=UPI003D6F5B52
MSSEAPAPSPGQPEVVLAKWSDRFFAWLIDFVIVSIAVNGVLAAVAFPFWYGDFDRWWSGGPAHYGIMSTVFFLYWTFFEATRGQSVGKMVLKIKTVDLAGRPADAKSIAIQSFGKAFLLPLDVILGWIFTNDRRQRIFNRASDTLVVKAADNVQSGVTYRKD